MEFNVFINDLIKNIDINNVPREIDLVLEGGAFNGAFQLGALLYLKQMERNKMIKIKRVSGTSIGAILGFFFIIDRLDYAIELNSQVWRNYRNTFDLSIVRELIINFMSDIDKDIYKKINKRLYITYFNVDKKKQIVKYKYKNNNQITSSIIKSSHVPYLIDGKYTYKKKYIDGVYPYIFEENSEKLNKRKILFVCLSYIKYAKRILSIKNEVNGHERILYGIMDINTFFKQHYEIKNSINNSDLCSYINNWELIDYLYFNCKHIFVLFILYIIEIKIFIKKIYEIKNKDIQLEYYKNKNCLYNNIIIFIKKYILKYIKIFII